MNVAMPRESADRVINKEQTNLSTQELILMLIEKKTKFREYLDLQYNRLDDYSRPDVLASLREIGPMYKEIYAREKALADIRTHGMRYLAMIDLLGERFPVDAPIRVLEIGCNTGFLSIFFNQLYPNAEVVAVDMAPKQIQMDSLIGEIYESDVKFETLQGQSVVSHFGKNQFDLIFLCEILEHIEYLSAAQREVFRNSLEVAKDDGLVVVTVPYENRIPAPGHLTEFTRPMLLKLLADETPNVNDLDWAREAYNLEKHFIFVASKSPAGVAGINIRG